MKKTISELLLPSFAHYRSVGELAAVLQFLLTHAGEYRDRGRWGESGPHETLINYNGCVNCLEEHWHSGRIHTTCISQRQLPGWKHVHDALFDCILEALLDQQPAHVRWRKALGIHFQTVVKVPMAYQRSDEEREAWEQFLSLHKHQLPDGTLNDCHPRVNVLVSPELIINKNGIFVKCCVTQKTELRTSPECYSRWDVCFLMSDSDSHCRMPKWNCRRETFAKFILRAVAFYKSVQPFPFKRQL